MTTTAELDQLERDFLVWVDQLRVFVGRAFAIGRKQYADVPQVAQVNIVTSPPTPSFTPPDTYQASAVAISVPHPDTGGGMLTGKTFTWSSSNTAVFTVNSSTGLCTAVGAGTATLTAECEGVKGTQQITVASPAATVQSVTVNPPTLAGQVGGTGILQATVWDGPGGTGNVLLNRVVTWTPSDTGKCTASADSGDENHRTTITYVATGGTPTVKATCEGVDSANVSVTITAAPAAGDFRTFTTPEMAYMLGPLTVDGKYTVPGMTNLESVMTNRLSELVDWLYTKINGANVLWVPGTGTISVTNGSNVITGAGGASFNNERGIRWVDGGQTEGYVYGYTRNPSGSNATFGGFDYWGGGYVNRNNPGATQSGIAYEIAVRTTVPGTSDQPGSWDWGPNYYDSLFGLWQHAAKKGSGAAFDATLLTHCRNASDKIAQIEPNAGMVGPSVSGPINNPRNVSMSWKIVRALDAKSNWWPQIRAYVTEYDKGWLQRYMTGQPFANNLTGWFVREGAYVLAFMAMLGAVDPDGTQRTNFLNMAIARAVDAVYRRQDTYGRWLENTSPSNGQYVTSSAGGTNYVPAAQPFINALVIHALILVHRAMRKAGRTGGADAANYTLIGDMIIKGCDHLCLAYRTAARGWPSNCRNMPYFTALAGNKEQGTLTMTTVSPDGDGQFAVSTHAGLSPAVWTWDQIVNDRQGNGDSVYCHAYAYWLIDKKGFTGTASKYLNQAKEQLASCMEFTPINGNLNALGSYWYYPNTLKNLAQHVGFGQMLKAAAFLMGDGSIDF